MSKIPTFNELRLKLFRGLQIVMMGCGFFVNPLVWQQTPSVAFHRQKAYLHECQLNIRITMSWLNDNADIIVINGCSTDNLPDTSRVDVGLETPPSRAICALFPIHFV